MLDRRMAHKLWPVSSKTVYESLDTWERTAAPLLHGKDGSAEVASCSFEERMKFQPSLQWWHQRQLMDATTPASSSSALRPHHPPASNGPITASWSQSLVNEIVFFSINFPQIRSYSLHLLHTQAAMMWSGSGQSHFASEVHGDLGCVFGICRLGWFELSCQL